jgi:predicted transcriptional regulator
MDKIFSTRMDEAVIQRIGSLARRLRTSKKRVIADAVQAYANKVDEETRSDVFQETSGAWRRREPAEKVVEEARTAFRRAMERRRS